MARHVFRCIDGHTAGNPVRLVIEGGPELTGDSMSGAGGSLATKNTSATQSDTDCRQGKEFNV